MRLVSDLPPAPDLAALVEELWAQLGGLRSANARLREVVVGKDELLAGKEGLLANQDRLIEAGAARAAGQLRRHGPAARRPGGGPRPAGRLAGRADRLAGRADRPADCGERRVAAAAVDGQLELLPAAELGSARGQGQAAEGGVAAGTVHHSQTRRPDRARGLGAGALRPRRPGRTGRTGGVLDVRAAAGRGRTR